MSEPLPERLSRFTPDAGALDRDSLLYAAGRAAARPNRPWIALAAALALSQALTLAILWPHPAPPVVQVPLPPPALEPLTPDMPDSPGLWTAHHGRLPESEPEDRPRTGALVESEPPLRAFTPSPPSLLN